MLDTLIETKAKFTSPVKQAQWMQKVCETVSVGRLAKLCGCSDRTIRSWKVGKNMMPFNSLMLLAKEAKLSVPKVEQVGRYEHTSRAGLIGSAIVMEKYGKVPINEKIRKENWQKWFDNGGKEKVSKTFTKSCNIPQKSEDLAEFIGIMLGDGGMSQFQITVTLHLIDDFEYSNFVKQQIMKLFGVMPSSYIRKDVNTISIALARKKTVRYLVSLGLVIGNKVKQQIGIPEWILKNEKYSLACIRGLMDTDGSIYVHTYKVSDKVYRYKKLCFSSASERLRKDVQYILHRFGSAATCSGTNVRIDSIVDVKRYMEMVGTHNPKHLKRYTK